MPRPRSGSSLSGSSWRSASRASAISDACDGLHAAERRRAGPQRRAGDMPPLYRPAGRALVQLDDLLARQRLRPGRDQLARRVVGEREADGRLCDVVERHVRVRRLALPEDLRLPRLPVAARRHSSARSRGTSRGARSLRASASGRGAPPSRASLRQRRPGEPRRDHEGDEDESLHAGALGTASTRLAFPRSSTSAIVADFSPPSAREIAVTVVIAVVAPSTARLSDSDRGSPPRATSAPSPRAPMTSLCGRTSALTSSPRARRRSAIRLPSSPVAPARKIIDASLSRPRAHRQTRRRMLRPRKSVFVAPDAEAGRLLAVLPRRPRARGRGGVDGARPRRAARPRRGHRAGADRARRRRRALPSRGGHRARARQRARRRGLRPARPARLPRQGADRELRAWGKRGFGALDPDGVPVNVYGPKRDEREQVASAP